MNKSPFVSLMITERRAASAFTLLELLVVISIIALLAGILLPVTGAVLENARKVTAKNTEVQIVAAVRSFQTDYGVYPVIASVTQAGSDTLVDGTNNQLLFNILRATDTASTSPNTRRTSYFEGKDVKNLSKPADGFLPLTAAAVTQSSGAGSVSPGALVDPWGNGYYVRYDSGYTDAVLHPYSDSSATGSDVTGATSGVIRAGVIAWSYGKDSSLGKGAKPGNNGATGMDPSYTYGDDVVSWQ